MKRRVSRKKTMLNAIYGAVGSVLGFFYKLIPNYAVTLLMLALVFKILLLPFGIKQQKNSILAAKLKPREVAIRKKYKGRRDQASQQKMQQEIMDMQRAAGFSPFGGCLQLLLQLPIVLVLIKVIQEPLKYLIKVSDEVITKLSDVAAKHALDIHGVEKTFASGRGGQIELTQYLHEHYDALVADMPELATEIPFESLPNFNMFGTSFDLSAIPTLTSWLVFVPIVTFVAMFFSMKLTRKLTMQPIPTADNKPTEDAMKSMQIFDFIGPLMSVWISMMYPAVIGVYWIFQNLFGMLQQVILSRIMPLPKLTAEDYAQVEREVLGKNPKKKKKTPRDPNVPVRHNPNSLHYIDEEDEDYPVLPPRRKEVVSAGEAEADDADATPTLAPNAPAPLKDDAVERVPRKKTKKQKAEAPVAGETTETETAGTDGTEDSTDKTTSEDEKDA